MLFRSDRGPHSCNLDGVLWFPRSNSLGADDDRGGKGAGRPVGVHIRSCEPRVPKDQVVRSYVCNIKAEEMRGVSGDDFEFGEIFQASPSVGGTVCVLKFSRIFHEAYAEFVLVDKSLTYEAFRSSTVEESNIIGPFLCGV